MAGTTTTKSQNSVGMYGTAVSSGLALYSGIIESELIQRQANLQKEISDFNAGLIEYDAWKVKGYGEEVIARQQTQADQVAGTTKVAAAGMGIKLDEGSSAEKVAQNELNTYLNMLDTRDQINDRFMSMRQQASNVRMNSEISSTMANLKASAVQRNAMLNSALILGAGAAKYSGIDTEDINRQIRETEFDETFTGSPSGYGSTQAPQAETVNGMKFTRGAVVVENLPIGSIEEDIQFTNKGHRPFMMYTMP